MLGVTLGCIGAVLWSRAERVSRLLSAALFAAGVLTLAGLLIPVAMAWAGYCFALVLILSIVRFWPYSIESLRVGIEYAYLMRFQVLSGLTIHR